MVNIQKLQRQIEQLNLQVKKLRLQKKVKGQVFGLKKQKKRLEKELGKGALRSFFASKIRQFAKSATVKDITNELLGTHSNPKAFVSMLAGNKTMTDAQKVKSLRSYIRKHGRRSSTLD